LEVRLAEGQSKHPRFIKGPRGNKDAKAKRAVLGGINENNALQFPVCGGFILLSFPKLSLLIPPNIYEIS
jgi:hypothetical protein